MESDLQEVIKKQHECDNASLAQLKANASMQMQRVLEVMGEKGASSWLSSLPLEEYNFALSRMEFLDAMALRYGWTPCNFPAECACGRPNLVQHAIDCSTPT